MKKLTRKLFISILSMAFAVIAIGTTTFAWITISNTATINAFEGTVEAGTAGIELSLDGKTWTSAINIAIDKDFQFSDITSKDGKTFNEASFSGNTATSDDATGKYISVTFKIRRSDWNKPADDAKPLAVYVDSSKVSFSSAENSAFLVDVPFGSYKINDPVEFLTVANAARMSLVVNDTVKAVYEAAQDHEKGNTLGTAYNGFAAQYWTAKLGAPTLTGVDKPTYTTIQPGTGVVTPELVQLALGETASVGVDVTLNVWVEGYDSECHANILKQVLTVALGFTTAPVQAAPQE